MKKIRKNTQLSLTNPKRAGRPPKNDKGIRHIERPKFYRSRSLHLTIKVRENKADIQTKKILRKLQYAILRARLKGLRVIHYALEYNHVHLLVESTTHETLHKGMQSLGITLAKGINKLKGKKGTVYKHRYHFRQISSRRDLKNVIQYILQNHKKHRSMMNFSSLDQTVQLDEARIFKAGSFLFRGCAGLRRSGQNLLYE